MVCVSLVCVCFTSVGALSCLRQFTAQKKTLFACRSNDTDSAMHLTTEHTDKGKGDKTQSEKKGKGEGESSDEEDYFENPGMCGRRGKESRDGELRESRKW